MLTPPALRIGDTIGVVSPSSPITPDLEAQRIAGVEMLESLGFRVKFARHALGQHFYSAGTTEQRVNDIHELWADPDVAAILMAQGGQTANNLLDKLDYKLFARQPKIFSGISDGTTLLNAISSRSGIVTFHGPDLLFCFGRSPSEPFVNNFMQTFVEGQYGPIPSTTLRVLRDGRASGSLWGGHSNILLHTMVAGYGPDFAGAILFLEGTLPVSQLDRHFHALRLAGVFEQINGVVLGHFEDSTLPEGMNREVGDVLLEASAGYNFPIIEMQELGHNVENFVLPLGTAATIDGANGTLSIDEPAVRL